MLQKNAFGQKIFWISCTGSKVPFWQKWKIAKMALLNPCMKFKFFFGQKYSFEALWKWREENFFVTCPRFYQIQDLCRKKCKKGIFSDVQWWKNFLTHFSDSTHQECMVFAKIGHGSCYHHWNEIFAGVIHHDPQRWQWFVWLVSPWDQNENILWYFYVLQKVISKVEWS